MVCQRLVYLQSKGYNVHGVDVNTRIIDSINNRNIRTYELNLEVLVESVMDSGMLKVSCKPIQADIFIIAVPTPFKENHTPDLSFIESATKAILLSRTWKFGHS